MFSNPLSQIRRSSDAMLQEQFANLRAQIPLMYGLMFINAWFLGIVTYKDVPLVLSLGVPLLLSAMIGARLVVWFLRSRSEPTPRQIRRYLYGTIAIAAALSAAFGGWGLLLLSYEDPVRTTSVALYIFVGSIGCCYCLQSLPVAGWLVLLFGALPVTAQLLLSQDWFLVGIGLTFVLVACVILRTLASSHAALKQILDTRSEMSVALAALQRSEEHHRYSVELNPQIPWIADARGKILELSPRWTALTGLEVNGSLGEGWERAVHPDDLPSVLDLWAHAIESGRGEIADARYRLRLVDGSYRWHRARAWPRLDADGKVVIWYGSLEDIHDQVTAENALQESEERYRLAALASNDIIWDISLERDQIAWNEAAATVLGYPETAMGTTQQWWLDRIHPDDRAEVMAQFTQREGAKQNQWTQEFRFRASDGKYLDMIARGYAVRDQHGRATRLIGSLQDVTAQKRQEGALRRAAHYDALTKLPNRLLFAERLELALQTARTRSGHVGLVVLDVDRFKTINDNLGHDTGDALLREIAARFVHKAPGASTIARLGGDEFAIILPKVEDHQSWRHSVEKLLADVAGPMFHDEREVEVSLSAGAALAFTDGDTPEELHKSADLALYAAKNEGLGRVSFFVPALREAAEREKRMLADARVALQDDRIVPFYQPKVCLRTGRLTGFEALLRWQHIRGLRPPAAINAAFEDTAISVQLTNRMLDRVIADIAGWCSAGIEVGHVAINGSPGDFRYGDFADRILNRLHRAGLDPSIMELEVTETVFLGQLAEKVSETLETLSSAGVRIALDDFGTGYASLTHLKQYPVNALKIDRSFVSRLGPEDSEDAAIVGAVIDLARNLEIETVAEGIEAPAQLARLVERGCDVGQGFLFARPMAAPQVDDLVLRWDAAAALECGRPGGWAEAARRLHADRFS